MSGCVWVMDWCSGKCTTTEQLHTIQTRTPWSLAKKNAPTWWRWGSHNMPGAQTVCEIFLVFLFFSHLPANVVCKMLDGICIYTLNLTNPTKHDRQRAGSGTKNNIQYQQNQTTMLCKRALQSTCLSHHTPETDKSFLCLCGLDVNWFRSPNSPTTLRKPQTIRHDDDDEKLGAIVWRRHAPLNSPTVFGFCAL